MKVVVDFVVEQGVTIVKLRSVFELVVWQGYQKAPALCGDDGNTPPSGMDGGEGEVWKEHTNNKSSEAPQERWTKMQ